MISKRVIVSLLFWCMYSPISVIIWFLSNGEIGDFVGILFVGAWIIFDYLVICLVIDEIKKFRKRRMIKLDEENGHDEELEEREEEPVEEDDSYVGFRKLFSGLEVQK